MLATSFLFIDCGFIIPQDKVFFCDEVTLIKNTGAFGSTGLLSKGGINAFLQTVEVAVGVDRLDLIALAESEADLRLFVRDAVPYADCPAWSGEISCSCSVKDDQNRSCVSVRSISMAAMLAAAVVTAGVTSLAVLMVMVVTVNVGIVAQTSVEQCAHRRVSVPADTAVELDARFGECCLRTAPMPPQTESVHTVLH